jgi:hypothetical protein
MVGDARGELVDDDPCVEPVDTDNDGINIEHRGGGSYIERRVVEWR